MESPTNGRLREYLQVIRLVTSGHRVDYDGEMLHLKGLKLLFPSPPANPRCLARPHERPPGRRAGGWLESHVPRPEALPLFRAELARGAARAGRDVAEISIAPQITTLVSDDQTLARPYARAQIAHYVCRMGVYYARHMAGQGFQEDVQRVQQAYAAGGDYAAAVSDQLVDSLTITGTAQQCRARLEEYTALGVNQPLLAIPASAPASAVRDTLEALAPTAW